VRALLREGDAVRVLHLPDERLTNLDGLDIERIAGDVTSRSDMMRAVEGVDRIFHLAAVYALWHPRPERLREVNAGGTDNVLRAASDRGVTRVVYTSSIAVFGGQGKDRDATEDSPFALGSTGDVYARSKYEAHEIAVAWAERGLDVTIVAPCGPIGPGDVGPTPTGRLLLAAINMPFVLVTPTSSNMIDVRDVAAGHLLAAKKGVRGRSYLLGHENLEVRALVDLALEAADLKKPVISAPRRIAEIAGRGLRAYADHVGRRPPLFTDAAIRIAALHLRADGARAVNELGLPQTPIAIAVRDAVAWFAAHGYVKNPKLAERLAGQQTCGPPNTAG
jgi:dihydroflavonol-4-reductase